MGVYKRGDRWYVRWREHGQLVRKSLGEDINTKAEAAGKRIRQERRDAKLGIIDPSRCTLAVFADEYLVHRGSPVREMDLKGYVGDQASFRFSK